MVDSDPAWFSAVLAKHDRDKSIVDVLSVTTEPGCKAGDNYASVIDRATLKVVLGSGKVTTKKVIVKKCLTNVNKEAIAQLCAAFNLESIIYEKLLAYYETMINENSVPYGKFWPDCLLTGHNLIMFEDLTMSGFILGSRQTGLDSEHAKIVFINLARMHSMSLVALSEGAFSSRILPPYLMAQPGLADAFYRLSMKSLADVIRDQWGPSWSSVEKNVRSMSNDIFSTVCRLYNEPHKLSVVTHGDCWVNNMMFKYDTNGAPIEMKFVDFQQPHYNSYAWDLVYFLHSSLHPELLPSCKDKLIEIYSKEFAENLARFGHNTNLAPTIQDIECEISRLQPFSLAVAISIMPVTSNPSNINMKRDEMLDEEKCNYKELYEGKTLENTLKAVFRYFINEGAFQKV